jgi:hypothetical protein
MNCIHCQSEAIVKNGTKTLKTGQVLQQYLCNTCGRRFNERSGTPMARLRTPVTTVEMALRGCLINRKGVKKALCSKADYTDVKPPESMSKAYPSDLTRNQFELIAAKLPTDSSRGRLRTTSYWAILNAIFYVLCEGCTWRGLPRRLSSLANGLHLLPPLEPRRHLASDS